MKRNEFAAGRLQLVTRIFRPEPAAAAFRLNAVAQEAQKTGLRVSVLTTRFKKYRNESFSGVSVLRFPVFRDATGYVRGYLSYLSFDLPLFFRMLATKRPHIVVVEPPPTTGAVARIVCRLRRVPYLWYAADIWSDATEATEVHPVVKRIVRGTERFAVRGAAGIVAVSDGVAERIRDLGGENIRVIPNGIDTGIYSPTAKPLSKAELRQIGITKPYFIYAGTASEWQKAEIFAAALSESQRLQSEIQLLYVGNGSSWPKLKEMQGSLSSAGHAPIVLLGPQSPQRTARLLRGAIGALVSISSDSGYDFAYPTKVLAALSTGTPVVYAGPGPARRDIEKGKFGVTVDFEAGSVEEAMLEVIDNRENMATPAQFHAWVKENKSLQATGSGVIGFAEALMRE